MFLLVQRDLKVVGGVKGGGVGGRDIDPITSMTEWGGWNGTLVT